ncbi:MAG: copper homeostasis protein CutC [Erysipelothrix sp.]|nr:copper homeostasis protein CutC [Erysipelothrix sp.]
MNTIRKEACCGSVRDVVIADRLNFDQIELNSSLENGGMTPSVGTLRMAKQLTNIPIYTMVRARPQGFNYTEEDYQSMLIDAKVLIENGADGIVFGFLTDEGHVDVKRTQEMVDVIGDKPAIFHKAFDSTADLEIAIKQLIDLKITRILTGGGLGNIMDNLDTLAQLEAKYGDQIELLIGGGVRDHNVKEILEKTKIKQIHFSGSTGIFDNSTFINSSNQNKDDFTYVGASEAKMQAIINEIRKVGKND